MNRGEQHEGGVYYRQSKDGGMAFRWMAPESFKGRRFDAKTDVWSLGVVVYQLLTGQATPYAEIRSSLDVMAGLIDGSLDLRRSLPALRAVWTPLLALARACLDRDPTKRPTAAEARDRLRHPQEIKASDGVDAILAAMRNFAADANVQRQAGQALEELTEQDEAMRVCVEVRERDVL